MNFTTDTSSRPDSRHGLLMLSTAASASETQSNARLVEMLRTVADSVESRAPAIEIHIAGAAVVAVGNAAQIKHDSLVAITLAVVLIVALLLYAFRDIRNLLLVVVATAWGWLFAMGVTGAVSGEVSMIVIGISSVVVGIAVNYPLHLVAHLRHTPDIRTTLREIAAPLVVGNITTVGAFAALVPLRSVALRSLGLFAALLLVGTVLFVLLVMPHLVRMPRHVASDTPVVERKPRCGRRILIWAVVTLTVVLAVGSLRVRFDSNMAHINYMSPTARADMATLSTMLRTGGGDESVVTRLSPLKVSVRDIDALVSDAVPGAYAFDIAGMNSSIAESLSTDFNYIGIVCSLVVFLFLWLSFGGIELALLAFLPMAVSWIWILGIMGWGSIEFNVVNVILATFIFGQGDDYTIFIVEGCQHEYAYRRPILSSYKRSIGLSALVMSIGMGTLIVARHPALHSLPR